MAYLEISKDLPIDVEVGQTVTFDFEGSPVVLKIMRKEKGKIYAKQLDPNKFLTPEQADERVWVAPKS